jgi:nitroreductase
MSEFDLATVDRLLSTTRAVRRRLDPARPVPRSVIEECLRLAIQAPSGGDAQNWHWIVVTDAETRAALAELYRRSRQRAEKDVEIPEHLLAQADYLTEHLHEVPVHVLVFAQPVPTGNASPATATGVLYGSIFPAVWSFQLALRSRGLGSVMTTVFVEQAAEVAELLDVPAGVVPVALLPVAYYTGETFRPAKRRPLEEVTYWEAWGRAASS